MTHNNNKTKWTTSFCSVNILFMAQLLLQRPRYKGSTPWFPCQRWGVKPKASTQRSRAPFRSMSWFPPTLSFSLGTQGKRPSGLSVSVKPFLNWFCSTSFCLLMYFQRWEGLQDPDTTLHICLGFMDLSISVQTPVHYCSIQSDLFALWCAFLRPQCTDLFMSNFLLQVSGLCGEFSDSPLSCLGLLIATDWLLWSWYKPIQNS